jgi:hypothetical protein
MFKTRQPNQVNNEITDVINMFAVKGKWKMIGSNSLRSIQYGSDYDIESMSSDLGAAGIAKHFQKAYEEAKKNKDIWITDFKCGVDPRLVYKGDYSKLSLEEYLSNPLISKAKRNRILSIEDPEEQVEAVRDLFILRWSPAEVKAGVKKMPIGDGTTRTLEDCIFDKTIMKIDLITLVGNQFVEISENYYIKYGGKSNAMDSSKTDLEADLEDDIQYYSKMDSFKALKRLFSLLQLDGKKKNKETLEKLVEFFNGQVGLLNKVRAELSILEKVLESDFKKVTWTDIEANLQYIKQLISNVYKIPLTNQLFNEINKTSPTTVKKDVKTLLDYFKKKINDSSKDFLKELMK